MEDGLPTWVCELMVAKPSIDEAIQVIQGVAHRHTVHPHPAGGDGSGPPHHVHYITDHGHAAVPAAQSVKRMEAEIQQAMVIDPLPKQ